MGECDEMRHRRGKKKPYWSPCSSARHEGARDSAAPTAPNKQPAIAAPVVISESRFSDTSLNLFCERLLIVFERGCYELNQTF